MITQLTLVDILEQAYLALRRDFDKESLRSQIVIGGLGAFLRLQGVALSTGYKP